MMLRVQNIDIVSKWLSKVVVWFLLIINKPGSEAMPSIIPIGAIFQSYELEEQLVFRAAIEHLNTNMLISKNIQFKPYVELIDDDNSLIVFNKSCSLLHLAPVAIFGPFNEIGAMQIQSICEHFEVPHLEARLVFDFGSRTDLSINLYPHMTVLSNLFIDLLKVWEWKSFVVIYKESDSIVHYKQFLKFVQENNLEVKLFQLQPDRPYRDVLWEVKRTKITNILLDVKTKHLVEVFRQAQQVGIMSHKHMFLVTSLDLHTLDLEQYRHSKTNVTSLRIVQEQHPFLISLLENWNTYVNNHMPLSPIERPTYLKSSSAMIYDGMLILQKALLELNDFELESIDCFDGQPWIYGTTLINYIRPISVEGITGWVGFDDSGFRANLTFDILSMTEQDFEVIGFWKNGYISKSTNWIKHVGTADALPMIRISTVINDPFLMTVKNSKEMKGNDRYEGYAVDLLKEIAKLLKTRFEIHLVKDGRYGSKNESTGKWDGMVGEVLRDEADIAIADLTINSNREQAIDFTYPFMPTGISIIYKKPTTKETSLWSFLSPFSMIVWIYLLGAFAGISLVLFYVGRFTPYEWDNPHPCIHHEPVLENAMNMRNSFWCTIGSLMQQGSDVAPKALSTRVISAIWYFFTLIIVSSYTANLAAFLTVEKVPFPFENVEQLAQQTKIKYGCLRNGATHKFFSNSKIPLYQKMAEFMDKNPDVLVSSNAAGRDKVERENGKYAFFMESATIEYITERYCNLTQVGGLLDSKGYGIATKKGAKFRAALSETILKLQETGILQQLKDRWWKQKGGGQCVAKGSSQLTELGLKNLGGVFVVLVVGSLFAFMLGIVEFLVKTRVSSLDSTSFCEDLWVEMKFILSCYKSTKVLKRKSLKSLTSPPPSSSGGNRLSNNVGHHNINNDQTADSIQMTGGLISPLPPTAHPHHHHHNRRNSETTAFI